MTKSEQAASVLIEVSMLQIELAQLRKGARIMAEYILAQPASGLDALSEARRVANDVIAASEVQS
jgi:hypothetical protein